MYEKKIPNHVLRVGFGALIMPGVEIGTRSIVASGSVVDKGVPSRCIVGGNPAKIIRTLGRKGRWS